LVSHAPPQPCRGSEAQVGRVWNPGRRAEVRRALIATGRPYAPATADRVSRALDVYTNTSAILRRNTCEATPVRGEQSETLLDARMACLGRRLDETSALVDLLAGARTGELDRAVEMTARLTPVQTCADVDLSTQPPLPSPQARA